MLLEFIDLNSSPVVTGLESYEERNEIVHNETWKIKKLIM